MISAYRDDLEAAQLRAADLQRELAELREHNRQLEAQLGGQVALEDERRVREHPGQLVVTHADRKVASIFVVKLGLAATGGLLWAHAFLAALVAFVVSGGLLGLLNRRRGTMGGGDR